MAAVYAATHRNGSRVAVKLLHSEMSTHALVRERFLWEGYVVNAVGHEGAVKVIDDDITEDGLPFLVTELLDGETIEERRLRLGGRLPESQVLVVVDRVLSVLEAAHDKGVIHRDLKPENVFLTRAGQVKLLDFGIARLRELSTPSSFTQLGFTAGTPAYMSPEQARGLSDEVDERSDLWACGAMMFCLLTGRGVHQGRTTNEQLADAITRRAPPLLSVAADVSPIIATFVDRALEFSKEMRWPDATSMKEALRETYQLVNRSGIETATPLTLGEDFPDRTTYRGGTVGLAPNRGPPTTSRPVASSPVPRLSASPQLSGLPRLFALPVLASLPTRTRRAIVATGVAGALAVVWVAVASMASGGREATHAQTTSAAMPAAAPSATVTASLSPLQPPEVSVTDLPLAATAAGEAPSGATRRSASPATTASGRTNCQPPFVVDADTGKKHWKLECL